MTVHPVGSGPHAVRSQGGAGLAKVAFGAAVLAAGAALVAAGVFGVAYAVGGKDATADNWVGVLSVFGLFGGLLTSVGAFVVALTAWVRHERTKLLWLPLVLFPALLAFIVLAEAFWWE